ncbi:hypothetical protein DV738_g556, partial [Chaetothyriales sp. CBS 135597]
MATTGPSDLPADAPGQPPKPTQAPADQGPTSTSEQVITPFTVAGGVDETGNVVAIDYQKLTRDFGATALTKELIDRFEKVTGKKAHRFMRRGIVISHREFGSILDAYEKGEAFYLYTGRGPSSDSMHVGHATPFEFTRYLQEVFDCPLVIQLTDDEKFLHSDKITLADVEKYARENAKDIIALGFDPKKTFIFVNSDYISSSKPFYSNVLLMEKRTTINQIKGTFGFNDSNNIGEFAFAAKQSAPAFATSFPHIFGPDPLKTRKIPCLIPCAIDQDPYFRQCRDNAPKLKYKKPAIIHSIFLPALQGPGSKMSASVDTSAIFLSDKPNQIKNKINKYAFSGGQDTQERHRELGGRTSKDVPYQYLSFFLEDDDELQRLHDGYEKGEILTGEMKKRCIEVLQEYVGAFQERRAKVTDETVKEFTSTSRKFEYGLNPNPVKVDQAKPAAAKSAEAPKGHQKTVSVGRVPVEAKVENCLIAIVAVVGLLGATADATRLFERRSDLDAPPVSASGWSVPLQGSKTCQSAGECTDSLTGPASNTILQALAIGKGLLNFTCDDQEPGTAPRLVDEFTELFNAAPMIPALRNEETFHSLVPLVLAYSYERMDNGTLNCMGSIGTLDGAASVITLYDIDTFEAHLAEEVLAPDDPEDNALWSRSCSTDGAWEVYHVETSGGRPPASCQGQPAVFEIEYASEYWFYRHFDVNFAISSNSNELVVGPAPKQRINPDILHLAIPAQRRQMQLQEAAALECVADDDEFARPWGDLVEW